MEVKNPHIFLSIVFLNKIIIIRKKKLLCSLKEIKINVDCEMRHRRWIDKTTEQNKKEADETKKKGTSNNLTQFKTTLATARNRADTMEKRDT